MSRGHDGAQDKEREDLEMEVDGEDNLVKDKLVTDILMKT